MTATTFGIEYTKVAELKGPLMIIDGVTKVSFDELVEIETVDGERRLGRVLEVGFGKAIVQVLDRKSTRLNSSHANISYAVFCLKKKRKRTKSKCTHAKTSYS